MYEDVCLHDCKGFRWWYNRSLYSSSFGDKVINWGFAGSERSRFACFCAGYGGLRLNRGRSDGFVVEIEAFKERWSMWAFLYAPRSLKFHWRSVIYTVLRQYQILQISFEMNHFYSVAHNLHLYIYFPTEHFPISWSVWWSVIQCTTNLLIYFRFII